MIANSWRNITIERAFFEPYKELFFTCLNSVTSFKYLNSLLIHRRVSSLNASIKVSLIRSDSLSTPFLSKINLLPFERHCSLFANFIQLTTGFITWNRSNPSWALGNTSFYYFCGSSLHISTLTSTRSHLKGCCFNTWACPLVCDCQWPPITYLAQYHRQLLQNLDALSANLINT